MPSATNAIRPRERVNVLGVGITPLDLSSAVSNVLSFLSTGNKGYICVTGMHGIMEAQHDVEFREIQNDSFITVPDGIPTVWMGHMDGYRTMKQVRGADLMRGICEVSVTSGTRHFLYGGKPGVANLLRHTLELQYPGINIVGAFSPPFRPLTPHEELQLEHRLEELKPDILWCGISTPKQERFMGRYIDLLPVRLMIGVGAAFDLNAGLLKDSPVWAQKCGLQWAHRLIQEPRRLWRRYLLNIPRFVFLCMLQRLHLRTYTLPTMRPNGLQSEFEGGDADLEVASRTDTTAGLEDIAA